ncbi:hypothetical protein ACLB2K_061832 [Fragaria x ananassa]
MPETARTMELTMDRGSKAPEEEILVAAKTQGNLLTKIATANISSDEEETELQANLSESLRPQELYWNEKSRIRWLSEGDRNTSFFHAICRARRSQSSITLLKDGNQIYQDPISIQNHIVDYYSNLFSHHDDCQDTGLISRVIPNIVTVAENDSPIAIPSPDEIFSTVKAMDPNSSPGPDGFSGSFFLACWDLIGEDVVEAVQFFFRQVSTYFKIIPKILSLRLASIASRIISPQQHAFVPGHNIADCILTTSECVNLLDNKIHGDDVIIFCRGTKRNLSVVLEFFDEYGTNSGQLISKEKSQVFLSKHLHARSHSIAGFLSMSLGNAPFTYLGVPIFRGSYVMVLHVALMPTLPYIWLGVRKFFPRVLENARWFIGAGASVSFWKDNFIGKPIVDFFNNHHGLLHLLEGKVADFIYNGS